MRIYDQTSRIYIYIANLDCHDLNVSALAPPNITIYKLNITIFIAGHMTSDQSESAKSVH